MIDNRTQQVAGKTGFARAFFANRAVPLGLLAALAFLAAGFGAQPACAQSQSKKVRENTKHATIEVITKYSKSIEGDTPYGSGSGYFINRTGLAITNNHVVDPGHGQSQAVKFQLKGDLGRLVWDVVVDAGTDDEQTYRADVLYQNEKADQALLQVYQEYGEEREYLVWPHYLKFFPGRKLESGLKAWCYGFPGGDKRKASSDKHPLVAITAGNIVGLPRRPDGDVKMIETDVLANPGNSGGPFVDIEGFLLGTLTLGGQTESRTNTTMLVPADLTKEIITTAFQRGKMPSGIDLEPFYTHLVAEDGHVDVPGYPRLERTDCMVLDTGDRICGSPVGDSIELPTPLGRLTLPCEQMAYLLEQDEDYGIILMDGGQRLPFFRDEAEFEFKPTGGKSFTQSLDEVRAVAFRKGNDLRDKPVGKNVLIGGSEYHLLLSDVEGNAKFSTNLGVELSVPVQSIAKIETDADDEKRIQIEDGSQVSGEFVDHQIKAVLAINGAPQTLSMTEVRNATIEIIDSKGQRRAGRSLVELFEEATPDLQEMARALETDDFAGVKGKLAPLRTPDVFNKLAPLKKDQVRLLEAAHHWRSAEYREAARGFKKLKRAKDENIKWYACAKIAVFKEYPTGSCDSQPLSDLNVFKKVGKVVADRSLKKGLEILRERDAPPPGNRRSFMSMRKKLVKHTEDLMVASQLGNPSADDAVVRIWNFEADLLRNEVWRLDQEMRDKQEEIGRLQGNARDWTGRRLERDIRDLGNVREATIKWYRDVGARLKAVGFIIDDPDKDIE